jgi:tRNA(Ile)-lysidine synthase
MRDKPGVSNRPNGTRGAACRSAVRMEIVAISPASTAWMKCMNAAIVLPDRVLSFLSARSIRAERLLVAVSGGPDSVALLRAVIELNSERAVYLGSEAIIVAHLNHRLRGSESDADECFVRDLVECLKTQTHAPLAFRCARLDVGARAVAEGSNLEDLARRLRYEWFADVARETGCSFVATGHTADDQAETVLHRLLRGTGLKGLRGIAPRRRLVDGIDLIRPLLYARRTEVLAYLEAQAQNYQQDSSNLSRDYTRNRIRHDLLPYLAANYNPEIVTILAGLAAQAAEAFQEQEAMAQELLTQAELPCAGPCIVLDAERLASAPDSAARAMYRLLWTREGWPMGNMGFKEWQRLAEFAGGEDAAIDFPGGIRIRHRTRVVLVGPVL